MKAVFKMPVLKQVRRLIEQHKDHDPSLSHIELSQAEYTQLCRELQQKHGTNSPNELSSYMHVDGECVRRVSR